jgi:hypothetical protein
MNQKPTPLNDLVSQPTKAYLKQILAQESQNFITLPPEFSLIFPSFQNFQPKIFVVHPIHKINVRLIINLLSVLESKSDINNFYFVNYWDLIPKSNFFKNFQILDQAIKEIEFSSISFLFRESQILTIEQKNNILKIINQYVEKVKKGENNNDFEREFDEYKISFLTDLNKVLPQKLKNEKVLKNLILLFKINLIIELLEKYKMLNQIHEFKVVYLIGGTVGFHNLFTMIKEIAKYAKPIELFGNQNLTSQDQEYLVKIHPEIEFEKKFKEFSGSIFLITTCYLEKPFKINRLLEITENHFKAEIFKQIYYVINSYINLRLEQIANRYNDRNSSKLIIHNITENIEEQENMVNTSVIFGFLLEILLSEVNIRKMKNIIKQRGLTVDEFVDKIFSNIYDFESINSESLDIRTEFYTFLKKLIISGSIPNQSKKYSLFDTKQELITKFKALLAS